RASATIKNGARINQDLMLRDGNQDIVVHAASVNEAVDLVGNFKTPVLGGTSFAALFGPNAVFGDKAKDGSGKRFDLATWSLDDPITRQNHQGLGLGVSAAEGGRAAGGSLGAYYFSN